jgi:hypothetical protein
VWHSVVIRLEKWPPARRSSARSITRFCSPLELNGSLNLERRSTYLLWMNRIGTCGNASEINAAE